VVSYSLFLFGGTFLVTYYLDSRSAIHRWVAMPFLHSFVDAEEGQKLAIQLLKSGLAPKDYTGDDESLATEVSRLP
jgi:dihydroorotate dehydrogenase